MPDQDSAAAEHALIQEIIEPLSTLPENPVAVAAERDFPITMRGYDRVAVDAYVARTTQLIAELQATRSPEAAVRRALERVGEEVSGVLQRAHEAAARVTERSRAEAEQRLQRARDEAAQTKAAALQRVKELDLETDRIWDERHGIVEDAKELARRLLALAESAIERFPPEEQGRPADTAEEPPDPPPEPTTQAIEEPVTERMTDSLPPPPSTQSLPPPSSKPIAVGESPAEPVTEPTTKPAS